MPKKYGVSLLKMHYILNPRKEELNKIYIANRRWLRLNIRTDIPTITYEDWIKLLQKYKFSCVRCHQQEPRIVLVMDHVIPLSKGGSGDISNIQPLCGPCNSSKGNRTTDYR